MATYVQGDTRITLLSNELAVYQGNGSVALNGQRTRPLWFDGRFLAAQDLSREQDYFLQRQADLGQAAGFGVVHGLWVTMPNPSPQTPDADVVIISAGQGITPAGELVLLTADLTLHLADLPDEENLDVQFGTSSTPNTPARTRSGLYVLALRPVEFTADPIVSYPTSVTGTRTVQDGNIVEATAVSLIPYPDPVSTYDTAQQRAALARQIFLTATASQLPDTILPVAMLSLERGVIEWVDQYLVRRDAGPEYSGLRFGLTDPATQQAYLQQYDVQLQDAVKQRRASGLSANFAAGNYFQALPPAGRFPLASMTVTGTSTAPAFSQVFFPQQMDVRLSIIPTDEIPALIEDSMSLPPIDLTLPQSAYADLSVFALIPVPRAGFAALSNALPVISPAPTLPQVLSFRPPIALLRFYQNAPQPAPPSPQANASWATVIGTQTYGFYIRRRSSPTFVDFTSPPPIPS